MSDESQDESQASQSPGVDATNLLLIVVGAHLRAEMADRPLAYRLRERVHAWLEKFGAGINVGVVPVVCSDVWYMNQEALHGRPTISLGGPGVNALSAYYFKKLQTAPGIATPSAPGGPGGDTQVFIQLDPEFIDLRVCIWGMNHDLTVDALELFTRKHLDGYLRAVATQVEPQDD
jgi:hypothetical protein